MISPDRYVPLYPVQDYILNELRETMRFNKKVVLMGGTGLGKTQIAIEIIKRARQNDKTCCFVAHRITLIDQTSKALHDQGVNHGVIQGNHPDYFPDMPVQVASVQTLSRRKQLKFDVIFFDEVQVWFKTHEAILKNNPDSYVIGLSATRYV